MSLENLQKIVEGRTVFFTGLGSSLDDLADKIDEFDGKDVLWCGVNNCFGFRDSLKKINEDYDVLFIFAKGNLDSQKKQIIDYVVNTGFVVTHENNYLSEFQNAIAFGGNDYFTASDGMTLQVALQMLVYCGAKKIFLFGCDGQGPYSKVEGKNEASPELVRLTEKFNNEIINKINRICVGIDVPEIYVVSNKSALDKFKRVGIEECQYLL